MRIWALLKHNAGRASILVYDCCAAAGMGWEVRRHLQKLDDADREVGYLRSEIVCGFFVTSTPSRGARQQVHGEDYVSDESGIAQPPKIRSI